MAAEVSPLYQSRIGAFKMLALNRGTQALAPYGNPDKLHALKEALVDVLHLLRSYGQPLSLADLTVAATEAYAQYEAEVMIEAGGATEPAS